ncbi:fucolectin-1-like [Sinocyclocheilus anshuiensis]|uniref:fucolectin-1-like n=1 Tax=Sinocyclocheilus anshuiensis TaxID=1608454 RepID=UPI0007B7C1BB|nr:PREDICTED: fucolectin-1-like [Sinocyclocheilus anshuiensis]
MRKNFVRLKFASSSDLAGSESDKLLYQLQSALELRGITNVKLSWTNPPQREVKQDVIEEVSQTFYFIKHILGNVAIGKNATQSPTHLAWEAEKAIDGIKNDRTKCSSTGYGNNSFWRLDLLNIYRVYTVVVTNRIDCCSEHLNGAEIRVGNSLKNNGNDNPKCAVISSIPAGVSYFYLCVGMVGRYVNLVIPGVMKVLTLCEVEVYGTEFMLSRTFIKVKLHSSANLTDPVTRDKLLEELKSALKIPDVNLSWIRPPVETFTKDAGRQSL